MWNIRSIKFIAVVVGMLGSTLKKLMSCIEEIAPSTALLQKIAVLRKALILRFSIAYSVCRNGGGDRGGKGFQKLNR